MPHSVIAYEATMTEPMIGLMVALGLAAYLVYTLLHPEKF
jgi:K+-transporting ATPase KdpF subunit